MFQSLMPEINAIMYDSSKIEMKSRKKTQILREIKFGEFY